MFYSLGYRINFAKRKIVATGGIYVRVLPQPAQITVDNTTSDTTGIFSNSVFIQNLMPEEHTVLIKKDGYYDYQKSLLVKEKEVTKLENVILFSKNISFETLTDKTQFTLLTQLPPEEFIIKNNNLYYSDIKENAQLTIDQKKTPLLKNVVAYKVSSNNIIWLGLDGFLKSSDLNGKNTEPLSLTALKINVKKSYDLKVFSQNIFLKEGDNLLLFDDTAKSFKTFYSPVKEIRLSPDGQKIIYFNDNELFIYYLNQNLPNGGQNNILLKKSSEKITDCYWLNNDYIVFVSGNNITISEIDARGNINTINLPTSIILSDDTSLDIQTPKIFFDQQSKLLYILAQDSLLVSEKLIP